jgi:hypothetical protein
MAFLPDFYDMMTESFIGAIPSLNFTMSKWLIPSMLTKIPNIVLFSFCEREKQQREIFGDTDSPLGVYFKSSRTLYRSEDDAIEAYVGLCAEQEDWTDAKPAIKRVSKKKRIPIGTKKKRVLKEIFGLYWLVMPQLVKTENTYSKPSDLEQAVFGAY